MLAWWVVSLIVCGAIDLVGETQANFTLWIARAIICRILKGKNILVTNWRGGVMLGSFKWCPSPTLYTLARKYFKKLAKLKKNLFFWEFYWKSKSSSTLKRLNSFYSYNFTLNFFWKIWYYCSYNSGYPGLMHSSLIRLSILDKLIRILFC